MHCCSTSSTGRQLAFDVRAHGVQLIVESAAVDNVHRPGHILAHAFSGAQGRDAEFQQDHKRNSCQGDKTGAAARVGYLCGAAHIFAADILDSRPGCGRGPAASPSPAAQPDPAAHMPDFGRRGPFQRHLPAIFCLPAAGVPATLPRMGGFLSDYQVFCASSARLSHHRRRASQRPRSGPGPDALRRRGL